MAQDDDEFDDADDVDDEDQGASEPEVTIEVSGLSSEEFDVLVEIGVIVPISDNDQTKAFQLHHVVTANTARKLRDDFELDLHGMALAMTLMRRIDELQEELNAARA